MHRVVDPCSDFTPGYFGDCLMDQIGGSGLQGARGADGVDGAAGYPGMDAETAEAGEAGQNANTTTYNL